MYVIFNTIEEGARGIAPYLYITTDREEAEENFHQGDMTMQYGESLYLYELPEHTPRELPEDVLKEGIATKWANVPSARELQVSEYTIHSEETEETYSR